MPLPPPKIVILGGELQGSEFPVKPGENRIGRVSENEIVIKDRSISRRHAVIRSDHGEFTLEDLESYNGIEIDGERVRQVKLVHGMKFRLGNFDMMMVLQGEAFQAKEGAASNMAMVPSPGPGAAPPVPANWRELFGDAEKKSPDQASPKDRSSSVGSQEELDLFGERPAKEEAATTEVGERRRRLGMICYISLLVLVVTGGLILLNIQSRSKPWEESRDYILRKGEKRVFQFFSEYVDVAVDDPAVVRVEPIRFMRKKEGEPRLFVLVEAAGPGTARVRALPSGETLRIIVQGMKLRDPAEEDEQRLTAEQRLQMGDLLLRSAELKQKENNLAGALKDFTRAERILRPIKAQDPAHAEARRLLRVCQDLVFEKIEGFKDDYYSARTSDPVKANQDLEQILDLIPDPSDPEFQITKIILDYRRSLQN
ncbi:MAG: FHA domain-containing protein [Planctomycetes bacterium]|nr:FHA domain-containing protein [Planctomycetota bacterium]